MRWLLVVAVLSGIAAFAVAQFELGTDVLPPTPPAPSAVRGSTGMGTAGAQVQQKPLRPAVAPAWVTRYPILTGIGASLTVLGYAGFLWLAARHDRR